MSKKIKFYLYIVGILWLGAAVQTISLAGGRYGEESIEAILMDKEYAGQLTKEQMEALTMELFAERKAETIQSIAADGIYSAYGYSSQLKDYVISGGERINLNVVSSYNEETDTTRVIVASPIYNEDF